MCTCNGSRIRKMGMTAVLFAEPHERPAESSYQEITLRLYMMEWMHTFRESIQSLRSKQKGIMIRKDMLIDMPVLPAVQQSDLLDMTIGCRGRTWKVDGNATQTKQMYHLVSCHQGGPWRLAAEFVIRGDGRPEATNTFRVDLTFTVRRQKQEQVPARGRVQKELKNVTTKYTEHVDMGKIYSRLERRRQRRVAGGSTVGSPAAAWVENLTSPRSGHSGSFHLASPPPAPTNQANGNENRKEPERDLQRTTPLVEKSDTASSQRSPEPESSRLEDTQHDIKREEDNIQKQIETPHKVSVTPAVTPSEDSGNNRQMEKRSEEKEASKLEETPTSKEKGKDKSMTSKIKERMSFRKPKSEKDKRKSAKGPEREELIKSSADTRSPEVESVEESDNKGSIQKQVTAPSGGEEIHDVQRATVAPSVSPSRENTSSSVQAGTQPDIKKEDNIRKETETIRKVPVTPAVTPSEDSRNDSPVEKKNEEKETSKREETPTSTEKGKDRSMTSKLKERMSFRKTKSEKGKRTSAKVPEEEELLRSSADKSKSPKPESFEESGRKASVQKQVTAPPSGEETHDVQRSTVAPSVSPITEITPSSAPKEKGAINGENTSATEPTKSEMSSITEPTETPTSAEKGKGRSMTSKLKGKMSFRKSKSEKDSKRKSTKGLEGEELMKSPAEAESSEDIPDDIDKLFEDYKKETGMSSAEPETPKVSPNDDSRDTRQESDNKASVQKQMTTPSGDEAKHEVQQTTVTPSMSPSAETTPPSVEKERGAIKRERSNTSEPPETPTSAEKGKSKTSKLKARLSFRKSKGDKDEKPK